MLEDALNRKDPSSNSEFRILYHLLQPSPYSEWTQWSPCSRNCLTHRTRKCLLPDLCGQKMFHESALCYVDDSACERLYSKKRKKKKSSTEIINDGPKIHPLNGLKCGLTPKTPDLRSLLRIIGGREASRGSWPWQVTILNKYREPFCGGTLLSQGWVLTAAHCVRKRLVIRAGEHDLMSDEGTEQESRVLDSFVHPDYDMNTVNNDVALLKLKHPFKFNQFAQPACLPSPSDELQIHTRAVILGWGKRKNSAVYGTDHLHQAEVPVVDLQDCRENYQNYHISSNMLCAGFKEGRVDSCAGDSGGPLLFQKDNKWTIFGITSFGEGCGQKGKYGIYANVPKYMDWIYSTVCACMLVD
ncbi:chymotrypsinogen B-like [Uloborus diversus]|uniref:chymotrypsinogen B-like n=1 Tax=Uloborus diversus TaxID=327109 RepID=UPI00240A7A88|nr:chymotrypsinogen B-like [Uloborus diversus]